MKRFTFTTALKAVLVGVIVSGMATACQNGESTIGGFVAKDDQVTAGVKAGSATTQSETERKAEQAQKIAEFLAKPEVKEMSAGLEEIAQAVAVAVEDKAVTARIYEKCMEKFDGETNTLWMHLEADGKMQSQGGWNKRVDAELSKGRKNATVKGIGNVDAAIKKFEKTMNAPLHLFWAFPANWDKKKTPLVAYLPLDMLPKSRTSIPAFDSKGNRYELDSKGTIAKQRPILVVTYNERTTLAGEKKNQIFANHFVENGSKKLTLNSSTTTKFKNPNQPDQISNTGYGPFVNFVSVTFSGVTDNFLWWEGEPEFEYSVLIQNFNNYYGTIGEQYLGGRFAITGQNAGNGQYNVGTKFSLGNHPNAPTTSTFGLFNFYEDDGWDALDWHLGLVKVPLGPGFYPFNGSVAPYVTDAAFVVSPT